MGELDKKLDELQECAIDFQKSVAKVRQNIIEEMKKTPKPVYIPEKEWDDILDSVINIAIALHIGAMTLCCEIEQNKNETKTTD